MFANTVNRLTGKQIFIINGMGIAIKLTIIQFATTFFKNKDGTNS